MGTLTLHIKRDTLRPDEFMGSMEAFAKMIVALSDDVSPSMTWEMSVEKGSMCINAKLVSDDPDIKDVSPMFEVINGNVRDLSDGKVTPSCPERATRAFLKLVSEVGEVDGRQSLADIESFGGGGFEHSVMPVRRAPVAETAPPEYTSVGSFTGEVFALNSKRGNRFSIVDEATRRVVKGYFKDDLLDDFRSIYKNRSTVSGIITYYGDGKVKCIEAKRVYREPRCLPRLVDLRGILEA